jgi:hypothetical protein
MILSNRDAAHPNTPQRLGALGRGLVLRVAVAQTPVCAVSPRIKLTDLADGTGHTPFRVQAAHAHSPEALPDGQLERIILSIHLRMVPPEGLPQFRHSGAALRIRSEAAHALDLSPQLALTVSAPRVDPPIPAEGEAVLVSSR